MEKQDSVVGRRSSSKLRRARIAISGGLVVLAGLIMVPYPGPGWPVVFIGLAILSQEFTWARHLLKWAKKKYDSFYAWVAEQNWPVRTAMLLFTISVVILTLWLVNAYGIMAGWVGLDWEWIRSPLFR